MNSLEFFYIQIFQRQNEIIKEQRKIKPPFSI